MKEILLFIYLRLFVCSTRVVVVVVVVLSPESRQSLSLACPIDQSQPGSQAAR